MKPRARRVTLAAAVLGSGILAVLVVTHWGTVRDHAEVWCFQLARKTETIRPSPSSRGRRGDLKWEFGSWNCREVRTALRVIADHLGHPVVFDPEEAANSVLWRPPGPIHEKVEWGGVSGEMMLQLLKEDGWRIVEQDVPRRSYVLIRDGPQTGRDRIELNKDDPVLRSSRKKMEVRYGGGVAKP